MSAGKLFNRNTQAQLGLGALPPASMAVGLLLLHSLMLTEGSAVYLHTQAAIKAVSLLSFRAAQH